MSARSLAGSGVSAAICGILRLASGAAAAADGETRITIYSAIELHRV
jgi:hypothetical protein